MLHDNFREVASKLATFLDSGEYGKSQAAVYALNGLGQDFLRVAKASGIEADTAGLQADLDGLKSAVKNFARAIDIEQGMDDVDFKSDIQDIANRLVINGVAPV